MEKRLHEIETGETPVALGYNSKFREYGIYILDGGQSWMVISHCPWCGSKLPESLRTVWFSTLYDRFEDLTGTEDPRISEEFHSDEWWKKRNL
jgi:hypothetical protein